jgi:replicative DNA helicase
MPQNTQRRSKSKPKSDLENFGHLQPQALELEQAVVGALLIESDAYAQVSDILKAESFYDVRHKYIFEAMTHLNLQQKPSDILTVVDELERMGA